MSIETAQFEIQSSELLFTDGKIGAWFNEDIQRWFPFSYFYSGELDIADNECYSMVTPKGAFVLAESIFS